MSLMCGLSTAQGQLSFSESFKYAPGPLGHDGPPHNAPPGQTGWTINGGRPVITAGSLIYPNVSSVGNMLTLNGANGDDAFAFLTPINSGVVWISYLMELSSGSSDGNATLILASAIPSVRFGLINATGVYGVSNDFFANRASLTTLSPGPTPDWLVLKLDFDEGTETLYVNPVVSAGEPIQAEGTARLKMTAAFQSQGFKEIFLFAELNTGVFQFDEVRIGRTLDEVRTGSDAGAGFR
jgi:hypothetical protein